MSAAAASAATSALPASAAVAVAVAVPETEKENPMLVIDKLKAGDAETVRLFGDKMVKDVSAAELVAFNEGRTKHNYEELKTLFALYKRFPSAGVPVTISIRGRRIPICIEETEVCETGNCGDCDLSSSSLDDAFENADAPTVVEMDDMEHQLRMSLTPYCVNAFEAQVAKQRVCNRFFIANRLGV